MFAIGFESGILERLPKDKIIAWCRLDPENRVPHIAHMVEPRFDEDDSLFALLVNEFFDVESVSSSLSSNMHSRSWSGSEANMWHQLFMNLKNASEKTKLPALKRWIDEQIPSVVELEKRAKVQEDEARIRGFRS
ncbi:MAG: hypothetical protein UY72_C0035G0010 [Candidatus Uhrbacteria bacterium GW2011_GWD2_52_7]|uniref:Uncharacterized protein n=1 Tax=Candidatus Uhrbacteria bacterium GW2011_GWD2_52_7 TaxID=1618989 RepID=A0A0G1XFM7_9BACT|nr:MAG: hypothetical protein UY72_C0035G0010 [Candidatus Uhrbacteria bacterium GW2011_GWD2_52_7]